MTEKVLLQIDQENEVWVSTVCEFRAQFDGSPDPIHRPCKQQAGGCFVVERAYAFGLPMPKLIAFSACSDHAVPLAADLFAEGYRCHESFVVQKDAK